MKAMFAMALVLATQSTCFASSVCILSYQSDLVCDGRVVTRIDDGSYTKLTSVLKSLTDKGYRIVSQSANNNSQVWTLVK